MLHKESWFMYELVINCLCWCCVSIPVWCQQRLWSWRLGHAPKSPVCIAAKVNNNFTGSRWDHHYVWKEHPGRTGCLRSRFFQLTCAKQPLFLFPKLCCRECKHFITYDPACHQRSRACSTEINDSFTPFCTLQMQVLGSCAKQAPKNTKYFA